MRPIRCSRDSGRGLLERFKGARVPSEKIFVSSFNKKGREARGIVSAEAAPALTEEIIQGLASFEDMGGMTDGGPAVSLVETIAQRVGSGEKIEALPDLIVHWSASPSAPVRGVRSPRFGEVLRSGVGTGRAGNHCPGAWVTLVPARSQIAPAIRSPARLEDVAATMCSALAVPHADLPGRPLLSVG